MLHARRAMRLISRDDRPPNNYSTSNAPSARATAISLTPSARARSIASDVGAETETSAGAPKIAAFSTISKEQRLVVSMKPSAAPIPARRHAPIVLSSALCRPTSSRTTSRSPRLSHQAAACVARVEAKIGCASSSSDSARAIAAPSGVTPCTGVEAEDLVEALDAAQAATRAPRKIASPRHVTTQRIGRQRCRRHASVVLRPDLDPADFLRAADDAFGQAEAIDEILEIGGRRHHYGIGRIAIDDFDGPLDRDGDPPLRAGPSA